MIKPCTIVLMVWNRLEYTRTTLNSLLNNTNYPYELIVIDNGSQPDTKNYLISQHEKGYISRLILNRNNIGKANANNLGWIQATNDYVCTVENDVEFTDPDWLTKCVEALQGIPQLGIVSFTNHLRQICNDNNTEWQPNKKNFITPDGKNIWLDVITQDSHPSAFNGVYKFKDGSQARIGAGEEMIPGNIVTRRDVIEKVGYHALRPVAYFSSASDFTIRVRKEGYITAYLPDVQCRHLGMDEMFKHMLCNYSNDYLKEFRKSQSKQIGIHEFWGMR